MLAAGCRQRVSTVLLCSSGEREVSPEEKSGDEGEKKAYQAAAELPGQSLDSAEMQGNKGHHGGHVPGGRLCNEPGL